MHHARPATQRRIAWIAATMLLVSAVIGPSSARASGTGAPTVIFAGEIASDPSGYDHVVLVWDERLDERVIPDPNYFDVTVCSPSPCTGGTPKKPTAASYLLSGLGGPNSPFDPSGTTFMRLDLDAVRVNKDSSIQIAYTPVATALCITPLVCHNLRDLSLTEAVAFDLHAEVFCCAAFGDSVTPIVDADYGADRIALFFAGQIDFGSVLVPRPLPDPADFVVTVTPSVGAPSSGPPISVERPSDCYPLPAGCASPRLPSRLDDLGIGILNLVVAPVAQGDVVSVSYTPGVNQIQARNGGAPIGPITDVVAIGPIPDTAAFVFLWSNHAQGVLTPGVPLTTSTVAPTTFDPVATSVFSPLGMTGVTAIIAEVPVNSSLLGYSFLGYQVTITTSSPATEAANPFVFRFEIDASLVPPGETGATLVVLRNGAVVGPCDPTEPVAAVPTPCVALRVPLADGDIAITVRTVAASTFNFATVLPYAFGGFLQPVDKGPVVNTTTAGRAIPVKFSLGGDRGMAIFVSGSPGSQQIGCVNATTDVVETTVSPGSSTLTYSPGTDTYTYVWRTAKAWAGTCRKLILTFGDGSTAEALFNFGK